MTRSNTTLTQQDLRLYQSQRNTDTTDGGGQMTSQPLTGKPNELFPPVSDWAKRNGQVNARLIYCAVLKPMAAALWGAHVIVSEPPQSEFVSFLMFAADYYGQERKSAMARVEAYATPASRSTLILLNTQWKGSRTITAYQRVDEKLPVVGSRYCLQYLDEKKQKTFAYFRVADVKNEIRTYTDQQGEFQRMWVNLEIQDALERDFDGVEYPSRYGERGDVLILETQIADSGKYYGISGLREPINVGDVQIKINKLYEKLVPTSVVEKIHADDFAGGKAIWIETAPRRKVASVHGSVTGSIYLNSSVLPASVELDGWTDDGSGSMKKDGAVLSIDYATGVISGLQNQYVGEIYAIPAAQFSHHVYSGSILIDQTNQGNEFVTQPLSPRPASGSVRVAFLSQKTWYYLNDLGDGKLRDSLGNVRGAVARTGTVTVSLPALPDEDSQLVVSWSPIDFYRTFDGSAVGSAVAPQVADTVFSLPKVPLQNLKPHTIKLTWQQNGEQTANDRNGELTGAASGYVNYAAGVLYPKNIQATDILLEAEQYISAANTQILAVEDGDTMIIRTGKPIQRGSLSLILPLSRRTSTSTQVIENTPSSPKVYAFMTH